MVTWARAFKAAGVFVGYSIIWDLLGGAIVTFGVVTLGLTPALLRPNPYQFADGIILAIIGFIILLLGNIATFFKVNTDLMSEDIGETYQEEKPITN